MTFCLACHLFGECVPRVIAFRKCRSVFSFPQAVDDVRACGGGRWFAGRISAILGVTAAVAVTAAALISRTADIAVDLGTRAGQVLAGEATAGRRSMSVRDVFLRGDAPSVEYRQLAVERLSRLYGVHAVDASAAGLLPEVHPYVTRFERSGDTVSLSGAVPSLPDRARILGAMAAAAPGLAWSITVCWRAARQTTAISTSSERFMDCRPCCREDR